LVSSKFAIVSILPFVNDVSPAEVSGTEAEVQTTVIGQSKKLD